MKPSSKSAPPSVGYRRIESDLRRRINVGQWAVGTMLPGRRDLAREYSVSPLTVERAITSLISDGTLRADNRRGTFVARGFVSQDNPALGGASSGETLQRAATIGIVILDYAFERESYSWDHKIVGAMEQTLSEWGHSTVVFNRASESDKTSIPLGDSLRILLKDKVDAIAISCFDQAPSVVEDVLSQIDLGGIPVACALPGPLSLPIPHVFYDNHRGGYQAAQHLMAQGYHKLTVFAPFTAPWVRERLNGIRAAFEDAALQDGVLTIFDDVERPWHLEENQEPIARKAFHTAIENGWKPTGGIIGINDGIAYALMEAASELGLKAGVDYGLLGFDDLMGARKLRMTSLRPPLEAMGRETARLLLQGMKQEPTSLQVRLHAHLIPRASTRSHSSGLTKQKGD